MNEHILLVEDDAALRTSLGDRLRGAGYVVDVARNGEDGLKKATTLALDLIVLDAVLPFRSGFELCRDIRKAGLVTPIFFLTARYRTIEEEGIWADGDGDGDGEGEGHVTKPRRFVELLDRIEALLDRAPSFQDSDILQFGSIGVEMGWARVTREGNSVHLSKREFQLLRYFIEHPGTPVSRSDLLNSWGCENKRKTRTVDMHVANLRQKLEANPQEPELILTVPRLGYKFVGTRDG